MTIECPECHATLPDDAAFCSKCGKNLSTGGGAASGGMNGSQNEPGDVLRRAADRMKEGDSAENELWSGGYSGKSMIGSWVAAGLFTLLAIIVGVAFAFTGILLIGAIVAVFALWGWLAAILFYRRWSVTYTLTNQRFVHERGILSRRIDRIETIDIDDVSIRQGFIERLLNVGTIEIVSTDRTDPALSLLGIDDVKRVAGLIDDARRSERRRRGLHIEQV